VLARFPIRYTLPAVIGAIGLIAAIGVGAASYLTSAGKIEAEMKARASGLVALEAEKIETWLEGIEADLVGFAADPETRQALKDMKNGWGSIGGGEMAALQEAYITRTSAPTGKKHRVVTSGRQPFYDAMHEAHHPRFLFHLGEQGYYDIFLFDLEGNIVYSVFKELDFATNFLNGEWKDSGLGDVFRAVKTAGDPNHIAFSDFKPYGPSHGAPASFIATAVLDEAGKPAGVLAFQAPLDRLNAAAAATEILGDGGDMMIVGADGLYRNAFEGENQPAFLDAAPAHIAGLKFDGDVLEAADRFGGAALIAAADIAFHGAKWRMLASEPSSHLAEAKGDVAFAALKATLAAGVIAVLLSLLVARSFARPLVRLNDAMGRMADGDLNAEAPAATKSAPWRAPPRASPKACGPRKR